MSLITPNSQATRSAAKEAAIFLERQRATAVWVTQMDHLGMSNAAFVPDEKTRRDLAAGASTAAVQCSAPGYGVQGVNSNIMKSYVLEARAHRPQPAQLPMKTKKPENQSSQSQQQQQQPSQQQHPPSPENNYPVTNGEHESIERVNASHDEICVQRMLNRRELALEKERVRKLEAEDGRVAAVGERAIIVPTVVVMKEPKEPLYLPDVNPPPSGSIRILNLFCTIA